MTDPSITNQELIEEISALKQRIQALELSESLCSEAVEELKESESRFRTLVENAQDMIYRMSLPDGKYEYVSPASILLTGYTPEEYYKKTLLIKDYIHPDFAGYLSQQWEHLIAGNMPNTYEYKIIHKSGEERWHSQRNVLICDKDGHPNAIEGIVTDITDRKRMEEALRESENRYRHLVEKSDDWIWETDHRGVYTYAGPQVQTILGYKPDEIIGKRPFDLMPDDEARRIKEIFVSIASKHEIFQRVENINQHKDGRLIILETNGTPFFDKEGNLLGYRGMDRDITERKKMEEALKGSEERYHMAAKATSDAVWDLNWTNGEGTLYWSEVYADTFGKPPEPGQSWSWWIERVHPEDRERTVDGFLSAIDGTDNSWIGEYRFLRADGNWAHVCDRAFISRDNSGKVLRIVGAMLDLTDRKQADEVLRKSEERHRLLAETMLQGVVHQDANGKIIEMNPAAERILGKNREQFLGSSSLHEEHQTLRENGERFPGMEHPSMVALRTGLPVRGIIMGVFNPKIGDYRWISIDAVPMLRTGEAHPSEVYIVFEDITDRKKAEMALKKRTQQLEEANKERESFSYSVSHDLRAPLRAIDGYSRMILRQQGNKFDENTRHQFDVIRNNTKMMGQLIEDLLTFSCLGRAQLSMTKIDMEDLIGEIWKELTDASPGRRLILNAASVPPCMGDHRLIRQVLINLLANAIKFTKTREEALIEVGGDVKESDSLYFVRDNGVGFDMQYYDKMFGVFQRLHNSSDFEGTGVGLAIVERIIDRHGGKIWAEGKEEEGATFYFTLPTPQE